MKRNYLFIQYLTGWEARQYWEAERKIDEARALQRKLMWRGHSRLNRERKNASDPLRPDAEGQPRA